MTFGKSERIVLFSVLGLLLIYCSDGVSSGKELMEQHCVGCHTLPDPDLLDRSSWENIVLPRMAAMMGVPGAEKQAFLGDYPVEQTSKLSAQEFEKIATYIIDLAPDAMTTTGKISQGSKSSFFRQVIPEYRFIPPSTTMVQLSSDGIITADANKKVLSKWDHRHRLVQTAEVGEGAVQMHPLEGGSLITVMGSFSPSDESTGYIMALPYAAGQAPQKIIDQLNRPVHAVYEDFDQDGLQDVVVCEYGKWRGRLSLFLQKQNGEYSGKTLLNQTGPIKSEVRDFDQDGLPDLMVLFGQGNEMIYTLMNLGGGNFDVQPVLKFSPSHGSSGFTMVDFDKDGLEDILYTAGDNADFGPIKRPYHGIYLYRCIVPGEKYELDWFQPLPGAYDAQAHDFDQDGDFDIAAISFFPDFSNDQPESFLYLENRGSGEFYVNNFVDENLGRWLVMDVADHDGDNDLDILLGSLTFEVPTRPTLTEHWANQGIPYILLENLIQPAK